MGGTGLGWIRGHGIEAEFLNGKYYLRYRVGVTGSWRYEVTVCRTWAEVRSTLGY